MKRSVLVLIAMARISLSNSIIKSDTDGEVFGEAAVAELAAFRDPFRSSLIALQESLPE